MMVASHTATPIGGAKWLGEKCGRERHAVGMQQKSIVAYLKGRLSSLYDQPFRRTYGTYAWLATTI